ncbi:hypothetical protein CFOL_v3_21663 [Cephalotus follicularis]|uniref:Exo_endo_phos domain-containing protein n=1 Tax=Cephalotus follicularis TaxID=3775 RepID=A0A1Q3CDA9_CEPFO|nr:hypothetical protein CFOL_v3_21663 [Cephalotus follicularis]
MIEFERCIKKCEIEDLRQTRLFFSWSNKRAGGGAVAKKIDRAMDNWCWLKDFSDLQAHFPPPSISDHSPCILPLQRSNSPGVKPFKYLNAWDSHPCFLGLVKEVWSRRMEGSLLEVVGKKLRMIKPVLKELHRNFFKDPVLESAMIKQDLIAQQAKLDEDPTNEEARSTEKQLLEKYYKASWVEESFLKQKARVQWLRLGDSNSAYFHRVIKVRQARNTIIKIRKADGEWTKNQEEVGRESVSYFSNLLQAPGRLGRSTLFSKGEGIDALQKEAMGKEVTAQEIEEALWSQNLD